MKRYDLEYTGHAYSEYRSLVESPDGEWYRRAEVDAELEWLRLVAKAYMRGHLLLNRKIKMARVQRYGECLGDFQVAFDADDLPLYTPALFTALQAAMEGK